MDVLALLPPLTDDFPTLPHRASAEKPYRRCQEGDPSWAELLPPGSLCRCEPSVRMTETSSSSVELHHCRVFSGTVNAITPGLIETPGALEEDPTGELFEEILAGQAIKRRGRPEDIAECVAYLARPAAGFITGQTINVDGGHRYH